MSPSDSSRVTIVEVGPRDGLQNEKSPVPLESKLEFIGRLCAAGVSTFEATSFVNPTAVPQLADAAELVPLIDQTAFDRVIALVPNERGYENALAAGCRTIEVFAAATDEFSQANIRCTIEDSFERFTSVISRALADGIEVRGAVSVAFVCPFSGDVNPTMAIRLTERLLDLGCYEVAICDTVGRARVEQVTAMLDLIANRLPVDRIALHMHDTIGLAVDHVRAGYEAGIRTFDAAAGGLGGCPFAPGAPGNVATEALVRFFDKKDVPTGIDADAIAAAGAWIRHVVGRDA